EGGILARLARLPRDRAWLVMCGLFGAALLLGDATITPGISVLGAVEGLEVVAPALHPYVVPCTVVILIGLFLVQKRGTAGVGAVFGPIMLVWFVTIAVLGGAEVTRTPAILAAIVASQPLISGAFSLAQQAIQLGYSPRLTIIHTSRSEFGQIYVPEVNAGLALGCLLLVLSFRSSGALGGAYGIAVTGTMAM